MRFGAPVPDGFVVTDHGVARANLAACRTCWRPAEVDVPSR